MVTGKRRERSNGTETAAMRSVHGLLQAIENTHNTMYIILQFFANVNRKIGEKEQKL